MRGSMVFIARRRRVQRVEEHGGGCVSIGASVRVRKDTSIVGGVEYCSGAVDLKIIVVVEGASIEQSDPDESFPLGQGRWRSWAG